jgi:hypothetical protein
MPSASDWVARSLTSSIGAWRKPPAVPVRAEQLGKGETGALGLEVVQRDVDGCDGLGSHAAAADRGTGPEQLAVDLPDVVGIFTDQVVGNLLGVCVLGGTAGSFGVAKTDPVLVVLGVDLDE